MRVMAPADPYASFYSQSAVDPYVPPSFAGVEEGLGVIYRGGPETLTSKALREDLKWFATQQRCLEAMSARWLAELDRLEQEGPPDPACSCSLWLQENTRPFEQDPRVYNEYISDSIYLLFTQSTFLNFTLRIILPLIPMSKQSLREDAPVAWLCSSANKH